MPADAATMPPMPLRVAFLAAECEPWAKTGGLADVVDALARALGRLPPGDVETPVDVFLPRYRGVSVPDRVLGETAVRVPDPRTPAGASEVAVIDVAADGYRLRLVDHPAAFDRVGFYGDAAGDYADNAWRFGMFGRAALEALRADGRPVDVLHLHDWHTGPAAIFRDARYDDDPIIGGAAILMTLHNLAYHGWTPRARLGQLGLRPGRRGRGRGRRRDRPPRRRASSGRSSSTPSRPGSRPRRSRRPSGWASTARCAPRVTGSSGSSTGSTRPSGTRRPIGDLAATYGRADLAGKAACRADLLERVGFDPADPRPVLGLIGRLDPQKGFDLVAAAAPVLLARGARIVVLGSGHPELADPFRALATAHPDRVALLERFDRAMARRIYAGVGPVPDAVPVRAVRAGPDDRAALRDAADRPPDRRARRHGRGRDRAPGDGDRLRLRARRRPTGCCGRASGRWRSTGRGHAVGRAARPRDGGRLRLGDRLGAALRGGLPAGRRDPTGDGVGGAGRASGRTA